MSLLQILVVLAVVAAVGAVAAGLVTGGLEEPESSLPLPELPDDALGAAEVGALRFSIGFRGYRMDEVDDVLDRLGDELASRDARLAECDRSIAARDASIAERDAEIARLREI